MNVDENVFVPCEECDGKGLKMVKEGKVSVSLMFSIYLLFSYLHSHPSASKLHITMTKKNKKHYGAHS